MRIGLICEYNPFHNGHLYHINKIKEQYPEAELVLVMSGSVTERGDLSIINKWDKTDIALHFGIDLVIELPYSFASQSADLFCYGSIKLLNYLKVDKIVFGSENNNIEILKILADTQINNKEYDKKVQEYLELGFNYPTSLSKSLLDLTGYDIKEPNDILGIGYVREIIKNNYPIEPITIKRTNDYNSLSLDSEISSASGIREAIKNNINIEKFVPQYTLKFLDNPIFIEDFYPYLKYKIITEINELDKYQNVDNQIIPRIKKYIYQSHTLNELILNIKTKNYTYNKLKRMFVQILMSITKEELSNNVEYIRVLGFNSKGKKILNSIKKNLEIPILTTYDDKYLNIEYRVTSVINLITNGLNEHEYKIIIKD